MFPSVLRHSGTTGGVECHPNVDCSDSDLAKTGKPPRDATPAWSVVSFTALPPFFAAYLWLVVSHSRSANEGRTFPTPRAISLDRARAVVPTCTCSERARKVRAIANEGKRTTNLEEPRLVPACWAFRSRRHAGTRYWLEHGARKKRLQPKARAQRCLLAANESSGTVVEDGAHPCAALYRPRF